jgi:hypothetical protein
MFARRRTAGVVLVLGTICLAGCLPDRLIWLPDSSGFIVTAGKDRSKVVRYDVRQRALRVIADRPSQKTVTPGLSPDGKQIALARIERTKIRQTVQVVLLSQRGEVIHESEVFPFGDGNKDVKDTELRQAAVEWSPRDERLLIVDPDGLIGAYHIGNKTLNVFSGVQGGNPLFAYVFDRFIAGDGSGFLAQRGAPGSLARQLLAAVDVPAAPARPTDRSAPNDRKELSLKAQDPAPAPEKASGSQEQPFGELVFVDWERRVSDLAMPADALTALKKASQDQKTATKAPKNFMPRGIWQGPVLRVPSGVGGIFRIDCARRTVNFEWDAKTAVEPERIRRENILMTARLAQGTLVVQARLIDTKDPGGKRLRSEIWFPADGRRRTLVEEPQNPEIFPWISPSPDGTMAAIRYGLKDKTKSRILVVDDKGTMLAKLEVE